MNEPLKRGRYNTKDRGLKKRCNCPRRSWENCEHPFFFNYKTERGSLGTAKRDEAKRKLADIKAAIDDSRYVRPSKPTPAPRSMNVRRWPRWLRGRPVGAGLTRTAAAVPTTVLSGRNRVRRKRLCSNRRNRTSLQLLAAD